MSKILKYTIPVDGEWHEITGHGTPVHVGSQRTGEVQFWAFERPEIREYEYQVFGTGREIPDDAEYVGTTIDAGGYYVRHLVRRPV